jgi:CheY-like chemotaxis protein
MKLLIIEENATLRRLIMSLIGGLRLAVTECDDGAQALAAYAAVRPDWVLLDLALTGADALSTTRQISAAYPDARVVVVTDGHTGA